MGPDLFLHVLQDFPALYIKVKITHPLLSWTLCLFNLSLGQPSEFNIEVCLNKKFLTISKLAVMWVSSPKLLRTLVHTNEQLQIRSKLNLARTRVEHCRQAV